MKPAWLSRGVSLLQLGMDAQAAAAPADAKPRASAPKGSQRSIRDRLKATLRRQDEALSQRALRRTLSELQAMIDPNVSEVEGGRRAQVVADWYMNANPAERRPARQPVRCCSIRNCAACAPKPNCC